MKEVDLKKKRKKERHPQIKDGNWFVATEEALFGMQMSEICTVVFVCFFLSYDCINVWRFLLAEWMQPACCDERKTGKATHN